MEKCLNCGAKACDGNISDTFFGENGKGYYTMDCMCYNCGLIFKRLYSFTYEIKEEFIYE